MSVHPGTFRRRLLVACLALVANFIAAGVPVLHALAHEAHVVGEEHHAIDTHDDEAATAEGDHDHDHDAVLQAREADHDHDAAHISALHDDCVALSRAAVDFAFLAPVRFALPGEPEADRVVPKRPVQRLSSRAPPPGDPARAPPLV